MFCLMEESMWGREMELNALEKSMRRSALWAGGSAYLEEAALVTSSVPERQATPTWRGWRVERATEGW